MEYTFKCPFCTQELQVDESVAGSETACPSCNNMLIIPTAAQAREAQLVVPKSSTEGEPLIKKPNRPLEVTARGDKKVRIKSFRHHEFVKDGKDKFDETVSEFLQRVGEENVVDVHPVQYTNGDQTDYGVVVIFRGRATD